MRASDDRRRRRALAPIALAAVLFAPLGACAGEPRRDGCDPKAAAALVGRAPPSDAEAMRATGARTIRRIAPGDPVTRDFRPDRLTIEALDGKVLAASCG